jgi:hypothetical protein
MAPPRRVRRIVGGLSAVVVAMLGTGATIPDPPGTRVDGTLLLASREHWTATGGHACAGTGLYDDVGRGTRVVVRDEQDVIMARTTLRSGRKTPGGCRFAFVTRLPDAKAYTFQIGPRGAVYQSGYDDAGLKFEDYRLEFVIG